MIKELAVPIFGNQERRCSWEIPDDIEDTLSFSFSGFSFCISCLSETGLILNLILSSSNSFHSWSQSLSKEGQHNKRIVLNWNFIFILIGLYQS